MRCPSCRLEMNAETYSGHYGRSVVIDVCHRCNALWFDTMESVALSPAAVVQIISGMHDHDQDGQPLADTVFCPRCETALRRSQRRTKDISYTVHECPERHGHFITFYEFLREKDCVRPLKGEKLKALRAQVGTVRCSNCGASVDLQHTTECDHCHAAVVLLDPDALTETLERLKVQSDRRASPDANRIVADMVLTKMKTERNFRELDRLGRRPTQFDLLSAAFAAISRFLS